MAAGVVCWEKPSGSPQPPVLAFAQLLWPTLAFLGDLISRRAALALAFAVLLVAGSAEPVWEAIFLPSCRAWSCLAAFNESHFALACISRSPPVLPITPADLV